MSSPNGRARPRLGLPLLGLLLLAACSPGGGPASPGPADATGAPRTGIEAGVATCAPEDGPPFEDRGWPLVAAGQPAFLPVVMSSLITAGPSRFLYNVVDDAYRPLGGPDIASSVEFYALERDARQPVASVDASYLSSGLGRGLYRAGVDFDCVGEWGAEISLKLPDGTTARERLRFEVQPTGPTPPIGATAPRSESLTASTLEELADVTTDPHPYAAGYTSTVAQAVTSGRPSMILFATPAFCQTGFCGPTVDLVKSVARDFEGRIVYVNVEPYELQRTVDGLRPRLDADGHLLPVAAARDYGIPVEPYLFVVDAAGDIFASFEGIVGADELRAALEDVLAETPRPS
jgi:hypothetical protein